MAASKLIIYTLSQAFNQWIAVVKKDSSAPTLHEGHRSDVKRNHERQRMFSSGHKHDALLSTTLRLSVEYIRLIVESDIKGPVDEADAMTNKLPSLVLIAGSWHQGTCYARIIEPLQQRCKIRCTAVTLPPTMGDRETSFKDDVDAAREAIMREISQGQDVVVVAHSFGGMVGNSAIKGLGHSKKANPHQTATNGGVIGLILIASGFTLTGLAFMDPMFGIPPPSWKINKETGFADLVTSPRELFYHDLSQDDAEYWVSQLVPQNLKTMFEGGEHAYAGWMDVPTWFIGTIEDRGLPVMIQRMQVGMARAMGGDITHRELQSSHSPFLSMPEECVAIILQALEDFTGETVGRAVSLEAPKEDYKQHAVVPAVQIL